MVLFIIVPSMAVTSTSMMLVTPPEQSAVPSVRASGNDFKPQEIEPWVAVTTCSSEGTTICHLLVVLPAGAPSGTSCIEPERSRTIMISAAFGVGLNCRRPQLAVPASLTPTSPPPPVTLPPPVPVPPVLPDPVPPEPPVPVPTPPVALLPPSPAALCTGLVPAQPQTPGATTS